MKKLFFMMVMLMAMVGANAQRIASMDMVSGHSVLFLENGTSVLVRDLPSGVQYRVGMTIEQCVMRAQQEAYAREAARYRMPVGAGYGYGYGAGAYGMYGMYPMYGGTGTTFSVGNEHWGFSTSSSNYGGYKTSSTGLRIGSFQIGTSSAGYSQPAMSTPGYTRSSSDTSYEARKTDRYSSMKNNGVAKNSSAQKATATSSPVKATKEVSVVSLLKAGF